MQSYPEFIYATLILPSLFALTLISEGVHKMLKHESGWVPIMSGLTFLTVILSAYIILFYNP